MSLVLLNGWVVAVGRKKLPHRLEHLRGVLLLRQQLLKVCLRVGLVLLLRVE